MKSANQLSNLPPITPALSHVPVYGSRAYARYLATRMLERAQMRKAMENSAAKGKALCAAKETTPRARKEPRSYDPPITFNSTVLHETPKKSRYMDYTEYQRKFASKPSKL